MQRTSTMSEEATTLTLPVPDDGSLHLKFRLQDEVAMLFLRVGIVSALWEKQFHCKMSSFSTTGLHAVRTVRPGRNIFLWRFLLWSIQNSAQTMFPTSFVPHTLRFSFCCVLIQAKFQSSQETLSVYNSYTSPSGSYIQISPVDTSPAQVTLTFEIIVQLTNINYSLCGCMTTICNPSDRSASAAGRGKHISTNWAALRGMSAQTTETAAPALNNFWILQP